MIDSLEKPVVTRPRSETAFGCPRDFLQNRFVYVVVSPRAQGLSIGVNLNVDAYCNFDCAYCEVDRRTPGRATELDLDALATELEATLNQVTSGALLALPRYAKLAPELAQLRHVAISGDGEPTTSPQFLEAVQMITHLSARGRVPFFKMVLITNASQLDQEQVRAGLRLFTGRDEIWAKLDAGTQEYFQTVNRPDVSIEAIHSAILNLAQERPVVIQSLFPLLNGKDPSPEEISAFANRLKALKDAGAKISLVQIYSASRTPMNPSCGHLSLKSLSRIALAVSQTTGLQVRVF